MPSKPPKLRPRWPSWRHHGQSWRQVPADWPNFAHLAPIIAQISRESSPKWRPTPQKATPESPGGLQAPFFIDFRPLQHKSSSILDPSRPSVFKKNHHGFLWLSGLVFILTYQICHHHCLRPCTPRHLKAKGPAAEALAFKYVYIYIYIYIHT